MTLDRINPTLLEAQYAVRGAIPIRADVIQHVSKAVSVVLV